MHIVLIGYLFVIAMLAVASDSLLRGGLIMLLFGALPCGLVLWRMRRRQMRRMEQ